MARKKYDGHLDDDDVEIPDGGVVHVPLLLTDARRFAFDARDHQPHYVRVTDTAVSDARKAANAAYDEMVARAAHAWRPSRTDASFTADSSRRSLDAEQAQRLRGPVEHRDLSVGRQSFVVWPEMFRQRPTAQLLAGYAREFQIENHYRGLLFAE